MRFSQQRECIKNVLLATTTHPDAEWIYLQVRKQLPTVSLGTVYRNLKEMVSLGQIVTLETEKSKICYDGDISPHSHFVCESCGKIIDLFEVSSLKNELEKDGHKVNCEKSILYGTCKNCLGNKDVQKHMQ